MSGMLFYWLLWFWLFAHLSCASGSTDNQIAACFKAQLRSAILSKEPDGEKSPGLAAAKRVCKGAVLNAVLFQL